MVNSNMLRDEPLTSLPADQRSLLLEIGPRWGEDIEGHRQLVIDAYTPLAAAAPNTGITVERDIPYGAHPRQVLDVFQPARNNGKPLDTVVFVHGGAYVRGKKSVNGHIYDNVCYWFASQGLVAINVEYRLADVAPFPGGADDVRDALALVRSESERLGIDAQRLFLIGHSAGGTHAATYLFDPLFSGGDRSGVAGAVLISARLAADVRVGNPNANPVRAYFGQDEALYAQRSPLTYAESCDVPLLIAIAEFENPYLDAYGTEFFLRALKHRTSAPRFIQMRGHNHTSIVAHFNSGEDYLGREILSFIKAV